MRLDGARVLITGASSGIGACLATQLDRRGATVLAAGRDQDALRRWQGRSVDLTERGAAAELAQWAGEIDVLVGNAGLGWAGEFAEMPAGKITELVTVNLVANMQLARELVPGMVRRGRGAVTFVSSIAGYLGVADEVAYAATKAGLTGFADSLRLSLAPHGVSVSVLVPGVVDTPFFSRRGRGYTRTSPRPITADSAAAAMIDAIERGTPEVFAPRWLRGPARLNGAAPAIVRALRSRFE